MFVDETTGIVENMCDETIGENNKPMFRAMVGFGMLVATCRACVLKFIIVVVIIHLGARVASCVSMLIYYRSRH